MYAGEEEADKQPRDGRALRHMAVMETIPSSGPPRSQHTVAGGRKTNPRWATSERSHWTLCGRVTASVKKNKTVGLQ